MTRLVKSVAITFAKLSNWKTLPYTFEPNIFHALIFRNCNCSLIKHSMDFHILQKNFRRHQLYEEKTFNPNLLWLFDLMVFFSVIWLDFWFDFYARAEKTLRFAQHCLQEFILATLLSTKICLNKKTCLMEGRLSALKPTGNQTSNFTVQVLALLRLKFASS